MTDEADYYAILEVKPDADDETLRIAYRRLAWRYHPDIAGPEGLERMREINIAYQTLSDPERRKIYDASAGIARLNIQREPPTPRTRPERAGLRMVASGPFALRLRFTALDQAPVVAMAFSADGAWWALGQMDGRITVASARDGAVAHVLTFGAKERPGTLQSLRLSPQGALAVAWGFSLGTRVWSVADERTLWNTGLNAPSGAMDAVVYDSQPYVRLATPDAPIALASDDPFRWAEEGRRATAIYSRPLTAQVSPAWLTPLRCVEDGNLGLLREPPDEKWRTHLRALSLDGRALLTFSTGRVATVGQANTLRLWELDRRNFRGAQEPRAVGRVSEVAGMLQTPLATTSDLGWVATGVAGRQIRMFDLRNRKQRSVEIGRLAPETRIALSPGGVWLAIARGSRLQLFETENGSQRQEWEAGAEITSLSFSLDPRNVMLSAGLRSGLAELWSIQSS
jgi:WD40 repeat protein